MLSQSIQPRSQASPSLSRSVHERGRGRGRGRGRERISAPRQRSSRGSSTAQLDPGEARAVPSGARITRRCMPLCHHSTASYRASNQRSSKESSDFRRGGTTLDGSTADAVDGMGEARTWPRAPDTAAFAPSPSRSVKGASRVRSSGVHVSTSARVPTLEAPKLATSSATRGPRARAALGSGARKSSGRDFAGESSSARNVTARTGAGRSMCSRRVRTTANRSAVRITGTGSASSNADTGKAPSGNMALDRASRRGRYATLPLRDLRAERQVDRKALGR